MLQRTTSTVRAQRYRGSPVSPFADVVDHYDRGGAEGAPTDLKGPLKLTETEKSDLVAFLESLSSSRQTLLLHARAPAAVSDFGTGSEFLARRDGKVSEIAAKELRVSAE